MSDLDDIAADLTYAGTTGVHALAHRLTAGAAVTAELGVHVAGSGLLGRKAAVLAQSDAPAIAASMAQRAADGGVSLVKGKP